MIVIVLFYLSCYFYYHSIDVVMPQVYIFISIFSI